MSRAHRDLAHMERSSLLPEGCRPALHLALRKLRGETGELTGAGAAEAERRGLCAGPIFEDEPPYLAADLLSDAATNAVGEDA